MSRLKKSLSLLLALVMAMSCMSMSAFAAETHAASITGKNGVTDYTSAQEALDAAIDGDTITLYAGDYGDLFLRCTDANSVSVDLDDWAGNGDVERFRTLKNVTIQAAENEIVTVSKLQFETGLQPFDQNSQNKDVLGYMDVENLTIKGITFTPTGAVMTIGDGSDHLDIDGLTFDSCTVIDDSESDHKSRLLYTTLTRGTNYQYDDVSMDITDGLDNLVIKDCTFTNLYQVAEIRETNGFTFTGNIISGTRAQTLLLTKWSKYSVSGTVNITNNTSTGSTGRFLRVSTASAQMTITGNTVTGYKNSDDTDIVKIAGSGINASYTLNNNSWMYQDDMTAYDDMAAYGAGKITIDKWPAKVAEVNGVQYATLAAANAAAQNGNTITLLSDVTLTDSIDINKALTIDLNGYSITPAADSVNNGKFIANTDHDYLLGVKRGGNLTIQDSSTSKTGAINSGNLWVAVKATIKGEAEMGDAATITVTGGSITGYYYAISGNGTRHNTEITINGGTLMGTNGTAIFHPQDGTLTINGGSLTGEDTAVELRSGLLNVTGGTFTATSETYSCSPNGSGTTTSGAALAIAQHTTNKAINASITGGTFIVPETDGATAVKLSVANPQKNAFDEVQVSGKTALFGDSVKVPTLYYWDTDAETSSLSKLSDVTYAGSNGYFADVFVLNFYVKADGSVPTFGVTREGEALEQTTTKDAFFSANKAVFFAEKVSSTSEYNSLGIKNMAQNDKGNDYYMVSVKYFTKNLAKAVTLKMTVDGNTVEVNTRSFLDYLRNMSNGNVQKADYQNLYEGLTKAAQGASAFTN